ncbi:MAG: tetratricopeptide repeat protein, partial [Spirochaetaceae bacterium]|nr:tetratricopeptide repeat protein [Spirochaetaceae bacterium]
WESGRPDASLDYYQAILIIFPADVEALRGASEVYEAIGRPADAVEMRLFLVRLNDSVAARMDLAQTFSMAERYKDTLNIYQDVLIQDPTNLEALIGASVATEEMGMYRNSIKYRLELMDTAVDSGETWWHIARLRLVGIGDYEGGLKALETALEEGFSDDDAFEDLLISSPPAVRSDVRNLLSGKAGN